MAAYSDDTEITLGTGKLLGLFFLLAAVCGVFFAIGYSLGKSSAKEQALNDRAATISESAPSTDVQKPSATLAKGQPAKDADAADDDQKKATDLTFYKSVQQDQPNTQLASTKQAASESSKPVAEKSPKIVEASAEQPPAATTASSDRGAYMVQIAAVSKQQDADALAGALKRKSYTVFVTTNAAGTDKLFHVQVGPFASLQDAESMKAKLVDDGYSPIIKR